LNTLKWLENWYRSTCSDDPWDNENVISICALDNPGWHVKIEFSETPLEGKAFEKYSYDNGEHDWIQCRVFNDTFECVGDPSKLEDILVIFKQWVTDVTV